MCFCNTRSGFWIWFRIIKAALGSGMGVLAAMVFSLGYGNLKFMESMIASED